MADICFYLPGFDQESIQIRCWNHHKPPTPNLITNQGFLSGPRSRMENLSKRNLVRQTISLTVIFRTYCTYTPLVLGPRDEHKLPCTKCMNTPRVRDIPAKFLGHPKFLSSKPKEDKLSREGTDFSTTTPSCGRPPPHPAVSGPKNLIFVFFFFLPDSLAQDFSF